MTDKEKAIVMAYTGICMLTGDKLSVFYKYIQDIMGRPVYSHEFADVFEEIKEKSSKDFLRLCREETKIETVGVTEICRAELMKDPGYIDYAMDTIATKLGRELIDFIEYKTEYMPEQYCHRIRACIKVVRGKENDKL